MNEFLKTILIIISAITGAYLLFFIVVLFFVNFTDGNIFTTEGPYYDKNDLIENYEHREQEILEVRDYFTSILPEGRGADIEFDKTRGIFHVFTDSTLQRNWKLKIKYLKVKSLLDELNWTEDNLRLLEEKLDKANCISITGRDPIKIGWQRSGSGTLYYNIFEENLNAARVKDYDSGCKHIFYRDNVLLEYGGGGTGSQCFPGTTEMGLNDER